MRVLREKQTLDVQVARWCPERVFVELLIPEDVHAMTQIVFRTESHDQGYSEETVLHGTYEGSFTWFEAVIVSPSGHERCPRRTVQYNVHASSAYRRHEVVWDAVESADAAVRDWVRAVRGGDAVQLIPKAQWPGWINFVREAEIEIRVVSGLSQQIVTGRPSCYRPLQATEMRLLVLDSGRTDAPISCTLMHADVRRQPVVVPPYEALSYCWGDSRETREIAVRRDAESSTPVQLRITSALFAALQALRRSTGPGRVLWVDAVCINQDDLDERSSQVALMRDIYRQADQVVVWLGEGDAATHQSIEVVNAICKEYERQLEADTDVLADRDRRSAVLAAVHGGWLEHDRQHAFVEDWTVFRAAWFHRTWVVQEIFNAGRSAICCGADTVAWDALLQVNQCIPRRSLTMRSASRALMPPIFNALLDAREVASRDRHTLAILDVLVLGLDLDVSDPRDKLFAMLQFGRETADLAVLPPAVKPDYRRPTPDVFALFTRWWIAEHRSLRILSAVHALEGRTWQETRWRQGCTPSLAMRDLPSWSWGYRGHSNWATGLLGLPEECPYRASGDSVPDLEWLQRPASPAVLSLTGFQIGVIRDIRPYPYYRGPAPGLEGLHRAFVGIFDPLNLTGKWLHQLKSQHDQNYVDTEPQAEIGGHFRAHDEHSRKTTAVACISRCFFTAEEGFVGLCPFAAQTGDWVVVLSGGQVPYILRPRDESGKEQQFIGECYAQGYMEGQGVEEPGLDTQSVFSLM